MSEYEKLVEDTECKSDCPAGVDVPQYICLIAEGKFPEAVAVVRKKIPFPSVCGRVCFHPCENNCFQIRVGNEPIAIRALKRFAAEHDTGLWKQEVKVAPSTGKRIAIVGSGPAGLTAAYYLAKLGHTITVFDALPKPGGLLRTGMPKYKLPEDVLDQEIDDILGLGVKLKLNSRVDRLGDLTEDGYQAIFIAIGMSEGRKLLIPGADLDGVLIGTSFLKDVHSGKDVKLGERVVVLGGGGVACDVARTARRLGAREVHIACLESRETMPAPRWEMAEAENEGVVIHPSRTFTRILGDRGHVSGVECVSLRWARFDKDGGLHLSPIEGSNHVLPGHTVVFAVGQTADLTLVSEVDKIRVTMRGTIGVDSETLETGIQGVFAGGDVIGGPASVIDAIAAGRKAAKSIDRYLGGSGVIDETSSPRGTTISPLTPSLPFGEPLAIPSLPVEQRLLSFAEVELSLGEEMAVAEAKRCLRCDVARRTIEQGWAMIKNVPTKAVEIAFGGKTNEQTIEHIQREGPVYSALLLRNSIIGGLEIRTKKKGEPVENVIQLGCAGPGVAMVLKAYCELLKRLGVDYGFLHKEHCCGLPLIERVGLEGRSESEMEQTIEACRKFNTSNVLMAKQLGAKNSVYLCLWCYNMARRFCADLGVNLLYYADVLVDRLRDRTLRLEPQTVAYFPGGQHEKGFSIGVVDWDADWPAYRQLLDKIEGLSVVDAPLDCCQTSARDNIYQNAASVGTLITNCVRCHGRLQRGAPVDIVVKSFPDIVLEALGPDSP